MKRRLTGLLLAAVLCLTGTGGEIYGVTAAVSDKDAIDSMYVDLSGQVIQEGGDLSATGGAGLRILDAEDNREKQIQAALMDAWDNISKTCDLSAYQITPEYLRTIYFETLNNYPKYFYVKSGYSITYSKNKVIQVEISYNMEDRTALPQMVEDYEKTVAQIKSSADSSWSDMEKALYIHDYLARNCSYDTSYTRHSAYDALVGKKAVCQGYTLAFKELAQQLGLSCEIVTSDALDHAWNLVRINGTYYHVDVTWDDPVPDMLGRTQHRYFMKSTNYFRSGTGRHAGNDWKITGSVSEMAAADTKYDDYFWNEADTGFNWISGAWYGFDGIDSISKYTCSGTDFTFADEIVKIHDTWPVIGAGNRYWQDKFAGTGSFNGRLYYSDMRSIYELDVNTKTAAAVFSLTDAQVQRALIFGMHVMPSGEIRYLLSESPNVQGQICGMDSYWIEFDGNGADSGNMDIMDGLKAGQRYELPANEYQRKGYLFDSWNTRQDGKGVSYGQKGAFIREAEDGCTGITLYAQWKPGTEHKHIEFEIKNQAEATCMKEGYTGDSYCIDCGELTAKGETIQRLPHTEVVDAAVAASCTTAGLTQGSHCSVCGTIIQAQKTLPAAGHKWDAFYTVDKAATALEAGRESIHCSNCDAVKDSREIPRLSQGDPGSSPGGKEDSDSIGDEGKGIVTTTDTVENPDGSVTTTVTATDASGEVIRHTVTVTMADGSLEKTVRETIKNGDGIAVAVTETTRTDSSGNITGSIKESSVLDYPGKEIKVIVEKGGAGNKKHVQAEVSQRADRENGIRLEGAETALIRKIVGWDAEILIHIQDENNETEFTIQADTKDLTAGNRLFMYEIKDSGNAYGVINAETYTVEADGSIAVPGAFTKNCRLVSQSEAESIDREILNTIALKKPQVTLKKKGSTKIRFSGSMDMDNVKKITYKTTKKKVAAVSKKGKITGKKSGSAAIKVTVKLKNNIVKTVTCKVRVK